MDLYERHRITVDPGQEPERLDKYLQLRLGGVSRNKIQSAADTGCILVNDAVAKASYKVKPGDLIVVLLPYPPHDDELLPEPIPLDIVYEDPNLLVVNKPAGLVVHPAPGNYTGTLLNALLYHLNPSLQVPAQDPDASHTPSPLRGTPPILGGEPPRTCPQEPAPANSSQEPAPANSSPKLGEVPEGRRSVSNPSAGRRSVSDPDDPDQDLNINPDLLTPLLAHRIDKDTSGLLLVAKDETTHAALARQFFDHTIERKYQALVWGNLDDDDGTIEGNLERLPSDRRVVHVTPDPERGKHAVTHWHVLERFGYVTLVECVLETGRTHQIRAHMRHIGHPLFNDATYGGDAILKGTTFSKYRQFVENCFALCPRQALHARVLGFDHPVTGEHLHFEQPLPPDMEALIAKWRTYSSFSL